MSAPIAKPACQHALSAALPTALSVLSVLSALPLLLLACCAHADDDVIARVLVDGTRASMLGTSDAASTGSATQKQLEAQLAVRPGELLEVVPGMVVGQGSGEGKANQFYLRGFNLDHGTDLRTSFDGMPVNQRSHSHGQGWTDLNFVIPELAARIDYRKGPGAAFDGDFGAAGSVAITSVNRLGQGMASVGAGSDGYARVLLAASPELAGGSVLVALEALHKDGPFVHPDDYRKLNGVLRYSSGYANNGYSVTAMAYGARWNGSDQLPQRAIASGALTRFDTLDASDGGQAQRFSLSGVWRRTGTDAFDSVSAYLIRNQLDLYSDFTYFLNDPINGDQFGQPDRRVTAGIDASHGWHDHARGAALTLGLQIQNDNIFNGLYATRQREQLASVREDHIVETSAALYAHGALRLNETLRFVAGLRLDRYWFDVQSEPRANSGHSSATLASPSLGLIAGPWTDSEFFLKLGDGFHSNDARAAVLLPAQAARAPGLVRARALEAGLRREWGGYQHSALSLYRLAIDSELAFMGDNGTTQAGRASVRTGAEFAHELKAAKWLALDASLAYARARWREGGAPGQRIPGAVEGVAQLGLSVNAQGPWSGTLRLRYIGPRPLLEDNSVRAGGGTAINARAAYRLANGMQLTLDGFNLANRRIDAATYVYASRLRGEAAAVADVHAHPGAPRTLRIALISHF
ncbi:MAG: TonB-dependent receptor [Pseudomonadota bacterium]